MFLLLVYVSIALGVSFLCSIAEAVILSISSGYISLLEKDGKGAGRILRKLTNDINKPLAAILTLNTIAHTMGAAGAGAQAAKVFGDAYLGLISAVLTLLILVFSEIIPKTLGATYWRQLSVPTAYFLKYLIRILYPFVRMSQWLTKGFTEESPLKGLNRGELQAMAALSGEEGQLAQHEANFVHSMLSLHELTVKDAITHRKAVFSIPEEMTVEAFFYKHDHSIYSRIPIFEDGDSEKISGYVMRSDLLLAQARGNGDKPVSTYRKSMVTLHSDVPLASTFSYFLDRREHMLLAVDEYGGLEGILTLEDLLESLLGVDIEDETDRGMNVKKMAKVIWRKRQNQSLQDSAN